jgi:hypothetical protein
MEKIQKEEKDSGNMKKKMNQIPIKILLICLPRFNNYIEKYAKENDIQIEYMYRQVQKVDKNTLYILHMLPRFTEKLDKN